MGVTILLRLKSEAKFTAENTLRKGGFIMSEEKIKIPSQRLGTFIPHKTRLILNCLSDEQYGRILRQLDDYAFKGITPEFDNPMEEGMFGFLKQYDDYDEAHYREIVEKRRIAGKKGAESRWNKAAE